MSDTPAKSGLRKRLHSAPLLKQLGPGLITGAADDDPSGIATYSQGGAQFGFNLLWTMPLTFPLMAAIQMLSALVGRVTGRGLAWNMAQLMPRPLVMCLLTLLFLANTINVGADLAAMGEAAKLVLGFNQHAFTLFFAVLSLGLQLFIPDKRYARLLTVLTFSLVSGWFHVIQHESTWWSSDRRCCTSVFARVHWRLQHDSSIRWRFWGCDVNAARNAHLEH